jgi:alkanesulfonate monooxygenase SsuD/methylene tetrahydromethanopterin reductase-like flavin-dependent oxidoreductase (luciferase family)
MDTYQNSGDASFRGGYAVAKLDPVVFVLAMAEVSKKVLIGITAALLVSLYRTPPSYLAASIPLPSFCFALCDSMLITPTAQPYLVLARTWSTLDHATKGRVALNVVAS